MPGYPPGIQARTGLHQRDDNTNKYLILLVCIFSMIFTLKLNAYGIVVEAGGTTKSGLAGMPGTFAERYILDQLAITPDQQVTG